VLSFPFDRTLYLRGSAVADGVVVVIVTLTSKPLAGKADAVGFLDDRCRQRFIVGARRCLRRGKQGNERCRSEHREQRQRAQRTELARLRRHFCAKSQKHIT
jgi:hypothetical protein